MIGAREKKGGVVRTTFACNFFSQNTADASKDLLPKIMAARGENDRALMEEYRKTVPPATLADVVAHIDHIVKIAGVNAAGIGSDFDGIQCAPPNLEAVRKFPNPTPSPFDRLYPP